MSIGPPIADGFYYDFEFPPGVTINEDDFPKIEAQMRKHVKAAEPFVRSEVTTAEAIDRYLREDQPYKVELIEDLVKNQGVQTVGIYENGDFRDLCRGPHAPGHGPREGVQAHLRRRRVLARRREPPDAHPHLRHRVRDQGRAGRAPASASSRRASATTASSARSSSCSCSSELSPGSPFWLPNGMAIWNELTKLWRDRERRSAATSEVKTPILYDVRAVQALRPLARVPARTCTSRTSRATSRA